MSSLVNSAARSKRSIVKLFVFFIGLTSVLFFAVTSVIFMPLMNDAFDSLYQKAEQQTLDSYALKLSTYIDNRLLLLTDVASSSLITNAALIANNSPALGDFMSSVRMLGENPVLTMVDINGDILFTESDPTANYQWTQPLLNETRDVMVRLVEQAGQPVGPALSVFELAVPVIYRNGREGVLVGQVSAEPSSVYSEELLLSSESGVRYALNGQSVSSSTEHIQSPSEQSIAVDPYGIVLTHIDSARDVLAHKQKASSRFLLSAVISTAVMCLALFFVGRKIILQPYIQLAELQNAVSKAVEGIAFVDPSGCYRFVNRAYADIAGYTPQELEGKPWPMTVYPEDLPGLEAEYEVMLRDGVVTAEARGVNKEGDIFYKQVTLVAEYNDDGELQGHHCFMKDISLRKENEKKQQDLIQALAQSNANLLSAQEENVLAEKNIRTMFNFQEVIFDNVPDMLFVKDEGFRIVQANKAFLNVYPEEMRENVIGTTTLESYRDCLLYTSDAADDLTRVYLGRVRALKPKKITTQE